MNMLTLMYVAIGGAVGSMCRYIAGVVFGRFNMGGFPLPTMIVNITGSFLLGAWLGFLVLTLHGKTKDLHMLVAVGLLGGYTTFSTFSLEAYLLLEKNLWMQAAAYIFGSVILSIAALFAGMWVLRSIHG